MKGLRGCLLLLAAALVAADDRDARWFNRETRTVTRVVKEQLVVTEPTPSSCVVVQTSLPPCRHLRQLTVRPTAPTRIQSTVAPTLLKSPADQAWKPLMRPSDPVVPPLPTPSLKDSVKPSATWNWDIFNLGPKDITVTRTIQEMFTTKYMDPHTVVTFSVKGCRPSRLPFDLPECKMSERTHDPVPEANVIVMAPVQFVPNMDPVVPMTHVPAKSHSVGALEAPNPAGAVSDNSDKNI